MVPPLVIYEQYRGQCYGQAPCYKKINKGSARLFINKDPESPVRRLI